WTGDEDQSTAQMGKLFCDLRNSELFERCDLCRDQPEDRTVTVGLLQVVTTKPRCRVHFVGEIKIAALVEDFPAPFTTNFAQHRHHFIAREGRLANRCDVTV